MTRENDTNSREQTEHQSTEDEETPGHVLRNGPAVARDLPPAVQDALGQLLGRESVETFGEWVSAIETRLPTGSISVEILCHADGSTAHWARLAGERHYFQCFFDGVLLSVLESSPVLVHTESPSGQAIEFRVNDQNELADAPAEAVFSFGVSRDVATASEDAPDPRDVYAAICPYVRAFETAAAYRRWTETVRAETVALPLPDVVALATVFED